MLYLRRAVSDTDGNFYFKTFEFYYDLGLSLFNFLEAFDIVQTVHCTRVVPKVMSNIFVCELGTADEGECGGRWNQLLCYP